MKQWISPVLLLAFTVSLPAQGKPIITVLDFNVSGISTQEMKAVIGYLSSSLFKTGKYNVIDVTKRDALLKEMEFSASGCSDEACQLKVGRMLTAAMIVVGDITKMGSRYIISARMLETETANTVNTADGMYGSIDALVDDLTDFGKRLAGMTDGARTVASKPPGGPETTAPAGEQQTQSAGKTTVNFVLAPGDSPGGINKLFLLQSLSTAVGPGQGSIAGVVGQTGSTVFIIPTQISLAQGAYKFGTSDSALLSSNFDIVASGGTQTWQIHYGSPFFASLASILGGVTCVTGVAVGIWESTASDRAYRKPEYDFIAAGVGALLCLVVLPFWSSATRLQ